MKLITKILNSQNLKKIGYIFVIVSIALFVREVYHFFTLISANNFNSEGAIGEFYKYKEDTLPQGYLWVLLLMFGLGLIKQNILGWLIPQTYLLIANIPFLLFIPYEDFDEIKILLLVGVTFTILNILMIRIFRKKILLNFFKINSTNLKYYYLLIVILASTYWILHYYGELIIKL